VTQPICLVLPDLFQDRLAKLTEHAAHMDMIIGAIAQHVLRVAPSPALSAPSTPSVTAGR
jgi:hypothetical protein